MAFTVDNNRIAKNTILLYFRTLLVMCISLYTSRVVLQTLGVDDYAIYQVVGGMVGMFSIISGSLSVSISRYLTYEIGTGNIEKLRRTFSTSLKIQLGLSLIIVVVSEILSLWFVEYKMTVPPEKLTATKFVLQFSIITFCVNLISVPFNACIVAHERMKAFAYIGIVEAVLKLGISLSLYTVSSTRLILYSGLLASVSVGIALLYIQYCRTNFEECRGKSSFDKGLFKELLSFSGWSFFNNSAAIVNVQGVTMLMNTYFGLTYNAARGLAMQVESAVMQFVGSFTTAINPQITKSYAAGQYSEMYALVCRGAKFSTYAMMFMAIPLIIEMPYVLSLWLGDVPEHTVLFARLTLLLSGIDCSGATGYFACNATGKMRVYTLVISPIGYLEFLLTWAFYSLGAPAVVSYLIFIFVKIAVIVARTFLLKSMVGLPKRMYVTKLFVPVIAVLILSFLPPIGLSMVMDSSFGRLILTGIISTISLGIATYLVGMSNAERSAVKTKLNQRLQLINA